MGKLQEGLKQFLEPNKKGSILFFDTETNGLTATNSILSISAIKFKYETTNKIKLFDRESFERFYFCKEEENPIAIECNGLTHEVLVEKRKGCTYPEYQSDDSSFELFCEGVDLFVAHNISFDQKFFSFMADKKKFCTMRMNTDEVGLPYPSGKKGFKIPTLEETSKFYNIDFSAEEAHSSSYDTEKCYEIFSKIVDNYIIE